MAAARPWVFIAAPPQAAIDLDNDDEVPAPPPPGPAAPQRQEQQPHGKAQYLGTWSHTERADLKKPRDLTKQEFGDILMRVLADIFRAPAQGQARQRTKRQRVSFRN